MIKLSAKRQAEVRRDRRRGWALLVAGSVILAVSAFFEHRGPTWLFWTLLGVGALCWVGFRQTAVGMAKKARREVAEAEKHSG
jgi:hypothetical protein